MKLIILGTNDLAKTIQNVAEQSGYEAVKILPEADNFEQFIADDTCFYPAFSDNELRYNWLLKINAAGGKIATIVHSSAYVSPRAVIGKGSAVLPNATVNNEAILTYGCIVDLGAIIDHNTLLGNGAHVAPGVVVKSSNLIPAFMNVERNVEQGQYPFQ